MRETLAACRRLNQIRNYTSTSPLDEMRTTFRMGPMSETGQPRKSSQAIATSALPSTADIHQCGGYFSFVP